MSRTRPTRAEVSDRILTAALSVFAERGFERASVDDVAAAAGLTKGAVYSNFASKDEVFLALMDRQVTDRIAVARNLGSSLGQPPVDSAVAVATALTSMTAAQPDWHRLFFEYWGRALRDPKVGERFVAHRRQLRTAIAEALAAVQGEDHTQARPGGLSYDDLAVAVLALSNGMAVEALADPGQVPESLTRDIVALVLASD